MDVSFSQISEPVNNRACINTHTMKGAINEVLIFALVHYAHAGCPLVGAAGNDRATAQMIGAF
ncbi:hypothetical protein GNF76_24080 [Pseudomonas sp. CCM 7893]|uniref:Uncharacterized protein n=1 Tax=Pseudomonas spelaei TaxID=1055469 RepID=A0A6I3WMA7_9PSED|nr:hypothetical protein [Pseudomonas spelaei]MUF07436.1 hypothetical protein [Pseudomonas spelaei]